MISNNYDKDIVLYKNGKYKELKSMKKVKVKKINKVLFSIPSNLYGSSYISISPKVYNKLVKIKDIKFSYKFLDGELASDDRDTIDSMTVKNEYFYSCARELFSKLYEILMCENCLNEFFWAFNSFWSFAFFRYRISFTYKEKNKSKYYKFKKIEDFYKFIFGRESLFPSKNKMCDTGLKISDRKYRYLDSRKLNKINKFASADNKILYFINKNQCVPVKFDFFNEYKSSSIETNLLCTEFYGNEFEGEDDVYTYVRNNITYECDSHDIRRLYILASAKRIIESLESSNEFVSYNLKYRIKKLNGCKTKIKFKKLIKRYFPDLGKCLSY